MAEKDDLQNWEDDLGLSQHQFLLGPLFEPPGTMPGPRKVFARLRMSKDAINHTINNIVPFTYRIGAG